MRNNGKNRVNSSDARTFIVFLDDSPGNSGEVSNRVNAILESLGEGFQPSAVYENLGGFALTLTDQQANRLRALNGVQSVEADAEVFLEPPTRGIPEESQLQSAPEASALDSFTNTTLPSGEVQPYGVSAVWQNGNISDLENFADDFHAFVFDTGVSNATGDLNLATQFHRSWINGQNTPLSDPNGHGTHVSGTIGAMANGFGVIGVAPGAKIVSQKVLSDAGSGSYGGITSALDWVVGLVNDPANGLDPNKVVANMSLGGGFSSTLDTAIRRAADTIPIVVAAGNSSADADSYSPAAAGDHPNVFTVSAVDRRYRMASFSNYDFNSGEVDDVDFAAPGVGILSTYGNGYATLNGTSMAAPHVAGAIAAGGVQAGDFVAEYFAGTADPFALVIQPPTEPEQPPTEPEQPPTDPEEPPTDTDPTTTWGTNGNDNLSGGDGVDFITGVSPQGTSSIDMGGGQIDVLEGGGGADVFMLGDSRGRFYDDRNRRSIGDRDYALITDFSTSEGDKLQLYSGSYVFEASGGELLLYWDRNGNGRLDDSKRNKDELIAKLVGVNGLSNSDISFIS